MATIDIIASFRAYTRGLLDAKSGPYASVAAANAALSTNDRQIGQHVIIVTNGTTDASGFYITGDFTSYAYTGGIDDVHLVPAVADTSLTITSATGSGVLSWDLDNFDILEFEMTGNVTSLNLSNGGRGKTYRVELSKNSDGYYFDIAADYDDSATYTTGDLVGLAISGQLEGKLYYKANQDITTAEPFDPAKWDLYIKLQDDVTISPSYSSSVIDKLNITPMLKGSVMYYAITPIYNVGEK